MTGLAGIVGQNQVVTQLKAFARLYTEKSRVPDHVLLVGAAGTGKCTIARAFAEELGVATKSISGELLERIADLTAILTSLEPGEIFLLDAVHRLRPAAARVLLPALTDRKIDLSIGKGSAARIHPFNLNQFTCVSAAPRQSDCPKELLEAFSLVLTMQAYTGDDLAQIAERIAQGSGISITAQAAALIAATSRGGPGQVHVLVKRLARIGKSHITEEDTSAALAAFGVRSLPNEPSSTSLDLNRLTGQDFELLISALLEKMGFRTETTKASGDGGIDIVATLEKPAIGGRYLIQCKGFAPDSPVGAPVVRELYGAVTADRKAVKGILITTSDFTVQAREFAEDVGLELIDGSQLRHLLAQHGLGS